MVGLDSDALANHIAREELRRGLPEVCSGSLPEVRKAGLGLPLANSFGRAKKSKT